MGERVIDDNAIIDRMIADDDLKGETKIVSMFTKRVEHASTSTNFTKWLELNHTMNFNEFIDFIVAVGKFHLGAHVKECFFKYSLNFITGAGQVDGEIMETLWSL